MAYFDLTKTLFIIVSLITFTIVFYNLGNSNNTTTSINNKIALTIEQYIVKFHFIPSEYKKLIIIVLLFTIIVVKMLREVSLYMFGFTQINTSTSILILFSLTIPSVILFRIIYNIIYSFFILSGNANILDLAYWELFNKKHYKLNNITSGFLFILLSGASFSLLSIDLDYINWKSEIHPYYYLKNNSTFNIIGSFESLDPKYRYYCSQINPDVIAGFESLNANYKYIYSKASPTIITAFHYSGDIPRIDSSFNVANLSNKEIMDKLEINKEFIYSNLDKWRSMYSRIYRFNDRADKIWDKEKHILDSKILSSMELQISKAKAFSRTTPSNISATEKAVFSMEQSQFKITGNLAKINVLLENPNCSGYVFEKSGHLRITVLDRGVKLSQDLTTLGENLDLSIKRGAYLRKVLGERLS